MHHKTGITMMIALGAGGGIVLMIAVIGFFFYYRLQDRVVQLDIYEFNF